MADRADVGALGRLPVIDVAPLVHGAGGEAAAAAGEAIDAACRDVGFFYVVGHGVSEDLQGRLEAGARALFDLPDDQKAALAMARGGRAWRGWFPEGGELTSGRPDAKEGFYLGAELGPDHPSVKAGVPLHGPNLLPDAAVPGLRGTVLQYLDALTGLGRAVTAGMAVGLGLDPDWFERHLTGDPHVMMRFFRYPPSPDDGWGVAEHTDYGLLTILRQDLIGGLEVHGPDGWIDAPPIPGAFVCNLGDMLERLTRGRYRSTPHRVVNRSPGDRLSFPFFFDPAWEARVEPIPTVDAPRDQGAPPGRPRWDGADPSAFGGTYGEYLLDKVSRVFPDLFHSTVATDGEAG